MPELLTKLAIQGKVELLLASLDRDTGLEKHAVQQARLFFTGMEGDCHGGITRKSDSRMLKQYKRNTEVRNSRQLSILSMEELAAVAEAMGIPSSAVPSLPADAEEEAVRRARDLLRGMIASFVSSGL